MILQRRSYGRPVFCRPLGLPKRLVPPVKHQLRLTSPYAFENFRMHPRFLGIRALLRHMSRRKRAGRQPLGDPLSFHRYRGRSQYLLDPSVIQGFPHCSATYSLLVVRLWYHLRLPDPLL